MKMLVHRTAGGSELPFVLDDLKLHLRVPDDTEDTAIRNIGWTAAAEIEQFAQIALLSQTIRVTVFDLGYEAGLSLPIGPVADDNTSTMTMDDEAFTAFGFVSGKRPYLWWQGGYFDLTPTQMKIEYQAGFRASASDIPQDLAQELMDQAALHNNARSPVDAKSLTKLPHVTRIAARFRGLQA